MKWYKILLLILLLILILAKIIITILFLTKYIQLRSSLKKVKFNKNLKHIPIDAVYTWVDSSDKNWQKSREKYAPESKSYRYPPVDYPDTELELSILLLFQNAPWINNVYIVTCNQIPKFLSKNPKIQQYKHKIKIIDHSKIIPKKCLPVFHSHAIEQGLHKIPNLTENFIYLNDDFFITRRVEPWHFFYLDEKKKQIYPIFRNHMLDTIFFPLGVLIPKISKNAQTYINAEKTLDIKLHVPKHVPLALSKTLMNKAERKYTKQWKTTACCKFSKICPDEVPPIATTYSLAVKNKDVVTEKNRLSSDFFADYSYRFINNLTLERWKKNPPYFVCINDVKEGKDLNILKNYFLKENFSL